MPSAAIVEVIPVVQARPVPGSEVWVNGLFNYRGTLLPLLGWSRLLGEEADELRMAARILVIRRDGTSEPCKLFGLLVEHVLGTERLDCEACGKGAQELPSEFGFLGPVVLAASGPVQLTVPSLLPVVN